jgi:alpha-amylase
MNTKHPGEKGFSPYDNPYEAFNNYMNVLSDFICRVEAQYPSSIENEELNALLTTIRNQDEEIAHLQNRINALKKKIKSDP